ncbi:MAG TPA: MBL fold metallo-hydrolase, partial [Puia sp.]|nr:MBL fold metallo-hydrolase [Puia sp.]
NWGFTPAQVTHLILSHAHIDHSGLIPKLVRDGFTGKVFCTPATHELTAVLLEDSAGIQEDDIKYTNKRRKAEGQPYLQPLYDTDDAKRAMEHFVSIEYGTWYAVDEDVQVLYTDAGHIIGSAAVHLKIKEDGKEFHLSFSGDVGRYKDVILRPPEVFPQADHILIESTYGNSLHDPVASTPDRLLDWIVKTCLKKKGKLIIPSFSVGRTQELLFALNTLEEQKRLPPLDYYVDSPLSVAATEIVKHYPQYFNQTIQKVLETDKDPFAFQGLKYIKTVEESKLLNYRNEPFVVISASGMADGGRVVHHISNNIENSRNTILLVGYCEPHSLGGRLMAGAKEVHIFGVLHEVHAEIGSIRSMSAHGDYEDLLNFLSCQDPGQVRKVFVVHGEYDVQQAFRDRVIRKGFANVEIPELHHEEDLL